jgi:hypothetical protein
MSSGIVIEKGIGSFIVCWKLLVAKILKVTTKLVMFACTKSRMVTLL